MCARQSWLRRAPALWPRPALLQYDVRDALRRKARARRSYWISRSRRRGDCLSASLRRAPGKEGSERCELTEPIAPMFSASRRWWRQERMSWRKTSRGQARSIAAWRTYPRPRRSHPNPGGTLRFRAESPCAQRFPLGNSSPSSTSSQGTKTISCENNSRAIQFQCRIARLKNSSKSSAVSKGAVSLPISREARHQEGLSPAHR